MEALVVECDIDVQDISINKLALIWDTMADNLVEGCADGFRKVAVV